MIPIKNNENMNKGSNHLDFFPPRSRRQNEIRSPSSMGIYEVVALWILEAAAL